MAIDAAEIKRALADMSSQFDLAAIGDFEISRFAHTISCIPPAIDNHVHLVDLGGHAVWVPLYVRLLGYKKITLIRRAAQQYVAAYDFANLGKVTITGISADLDVDRYQLSDDSVDCVVCFEVLEHLIGDPMHLISEANRILRRSGDFVLTTPNVLWRNNTLRYIFGGHPYGWPVYTSTYGDRHNREWTPFEVKDALVAAGFGNIQIRTEDFASAQNLSPLKRIIATCLMIPAAASRRVPFNYRNRLIFAHGRACWPVADRYPSFLYEMYGRSEIREDRVNRNN